MSVFSWPAWPLENRADGGEGEMYRAMAFCPVFESLNFTKSASTSNYGSKAPFYRRKENKNISKSALPLKVPSGL